MFIVVVRVMREKKKTISRAMPKPKSKLNTYWAYDICISHLILDKTLSKRVFLECQTVPLTLNAGIAEVFFTQG